MSLQRLIVAIVFSVTIMLSINAAQGQSVRPPDNAVNQPVEETTGVSNTLGNESQSDYWRNLRGGVQGKVSIPDKNAGVMVQSEGWQWMLFRNGPLKTYGAFALAITVAALFFFFLYRGTIKVEAGMSGQKVKRFSTIARIGHWLNAIAFIVLAITGLIMLYGKSILIPVIGLYAFSTLATIGKLVHNWGAYVFILGIVWIFLTFVSRNFFSRDDISWIAKAGGLFKKGVHPPSRFFNFGEKLVFWFSIIGGIGVIITGIALLFPYQLEFLPGELAVHKMQFATMWHAIIGLFLIVVVIGHIYLGSVGIEGALESMKSGYVDRNWAKEHHSLWLEELDAKATETEASRKPAE